MHPVPYNKDLDLSACVFLGIKKAGMTQKEAADALGTYQGYIGDLCRGAKSPGIQTLIRIANLGDIKLSTLIAYGERDDGSND